MGMCPPELPLTAPVAAPCVEVSCRACGWAGVGASMMPPTGVAVGLAPADSTSSVACHLLSVTASAEGLAWLQPLAALPPWLVLAPSCEDCRRFAPAPALVPVPGVVPARLPGSWDTVAGGGWLCTAGKPASLPASQLLLLGAGML
jgi:hypothetical protein